MSMQRRPFDTDAGSSAALVESRRYMSIAEELSRRRYGDELADEVYSDLAVADRNAPRSET